MYTVTLVLEQTVFPNNEKILVNMPTTEGIVEQLS